MTGRELLKLNDAFLKKELRGGKREGAGRPKSIPTKTLSYRVPASLANKLDKEIRKVIKKYKTPVETGVATKTNCYEKKAFRLRKVPIAKLVLR